VGRLSVRRYPRVQPWALIAFCTLWRIPGLSDPPWLNDEGVYASVGRALLHGEKLYRQVWENKPPGIYLLNAAAEQIAGASHVIAAMRFLALLASIGALGAVYHLVAGRRGSGPALLAVALAGIGLDLPLIDGTEANAEIFVAAASASGMALVWTALADRQNREPPVLPPALLVFLAGIAFGVSILLKLPAGADAVAAALVIVFYRVPTRTAGTEHSPTVTRQMGAAVLQRLGWLVLGAAIPVGAVLLWLAGQGLVGDALYATIGYNRGYVSTGQSLHSPLVGLLTVAAPLAALTIGSVLAWRERRIGLPFGAAMSWWLGLALLGALASGRTYPHYFLQAAAPAAICLAHLTETLLVRFHGDAWTGLSNVGGMPGSASRPARLYRRSVRTLVIAWILVVTLGSAIAFDYAGPHPSPGSDTIAYYAYYWQHVTGGLDDVAYGNRIDPRVERNVAAAAYIRTHRLGSQRLYVWGNAPWIYYLSGYEHAARFLSAFYRPVVPGSGVGVLPGLQRNPPQYIVVIEPPNPPAPGLAPFLASRYRPVFRTENAIVYAIMRP
jgi:hypothetical protein